MRIDRLVVRRYGPLEPRTLDFSAGHEGLHVVYGGNEWGKSLSLQALEHGLFSVPKKIDGFSEQDMLQLEMELAISRRSGDEATRRCAFRRLRQTLTAAPGNTPLDERHVLGYLAGVTAETFRQMYGLTGERIREGGRLLQKAKGDIAATLFAAATGLERIRHVTKSLDARQGGLYSPSGKAVNPRLNGAIRALLKSFSSYSSALQLPDATGRLETSLRDKEAEVESLEEQIRQLATLTARLTLVRAARSAAVELHAGRQRLAQLGTPPLLGDAFKQRLDGAREAIARADSREEELTTTLDGQRVRRDTLVVDERVLAAAKAIETLLQSTEELAGIDADIPGQKAEIDRLAEANAVLFRGIVATTGQPLRETASQTPGTHEQIEDLIEEHGGIAAACEEREGQVKESRRRLKLLEDELAGLAEVGDVRELKQRAQAVRDGGDVEKQLESTRNGLAAEEEEYVAESRRLEGRQTDAPADEMQVPSLAEVREHGEHVRELQRALDQSDADARKAADEIGMLRSQIAVLEQEGDLPAEGALEEIRRRRDALIQTTIDVSADAELPAADARARCAEIVQLVAEADAVVDQLLSHADRASRRRQHLAAIDLIRDALGRIRQHRETLEARRAAADHQWVRLWEPAFVTPKSPTAMEQWLAVHATCCTRAETLRRLRRECTTFEQRIADDRGILSGILRELGADPPAGATRRQLLDAATTALDDRQAKAIQRQQKAEQIAAAKRDLLRLEAQLEAALKQRDSWNKQWADCMAVLDQPRDATTATGRLLLDTMRRVATNEAHIATARDRITKMEAKRTLIHDVMRQVCEALDLPFDTKRVQEISREANERLRANQTTLRDRENLDKEIRETERRIDDIRDTRGDAAAVLAALREESGVAANEQLDDAWERSEQFRKLRDEVDRWEQEFLREAGNADAAALLEECIDSTVADIDGEMAEIQRDVTAKNSLRDQLRDQRKDLRQKVELLGGDKAARAWAECRMNETEVLERVSEYLPLRLASLALARASRRYRDEHHAPVLGRASGLFQRITHGRYSEIRLAENDIYAVRADSTTESVLQRHMSDGTRDQLYLALRLAALQHHHEQGAEPLPLILDDGLVQFDDDRTAAMLEVLADISGGMQVILLTHHGSVVAAARVLQTARPDAVFLHGQTAA